MENRIGKSLTMMEESIDNMSTNEFVRNANMKLSNNFIPLSKDTIMQAHVTFMNSLDDFMNKTLNCCNTDFTGVCERLRSYNNNIDLCGDCDTLSFHSMEDICSLKVTPEYLNDFMKKCSSDISDYIDMNTEIEPQFLALINSRDIVNTVSRQAVGSHDGCSPQKFNHENIQNLVIPFIQQYVSGKETLEKEYSNIKTCLGEAISVLCGLIDKINARYQNSPIDEKVNCLNQIVFNLSYSVLAIEKNIIMAFSKKVLSFVESVKSINEMTSRITSNPNLMESVYDTTFVPVNTEGLASRLVEGDISAYREYSENVFNFHSGIFNNRYDSVESDGVNDGFEVKVSQFMYDREPYIDVMNIYQNIFDSLNILSKNSDDYLLIFDDMIEKSGLSVSLQDRFYNDLELIDRITDYPEPVPGTKNVDVYYRILNDIKNYPVNMEAIAQIIKDVHLQYVDLQNRFENRINGEFNKSQAIIELQNYMAEFDDQFKYVVNVTASKLMARLKDLAYMAERYSLIINDSEKPVGFIESMDDFTQDIYDSEVEINRIYNESSIKNLGKVFYKLNAYNRFGINVVFTEAEDNQNNPQTQNNQPQQNANNGKPDTSTKVTVNDSEQNTKTQNTMDKASLKNVLDALAKWFDEVLNRFDKLCERQGAKNTKWLASNKDALMNRRYVNVTASILPYEEMMDSKKVLNELSDTANKISSLKSSLNTLTDDMSVIKALFPNIKITDPNTFGDACVKYFKVGGGELNVKEYANTELGNLVKQKVIPFCENYYDSYVSSVKQNVNKIKTSLSTLSESMVQESFSIGVEDGYIIYEAEEEKKDASSGKAKMNLIRKYVKLYTGSALNAIRDRNNDYFKLLSALVPKTKPTYSEKPDNTTTDTQATTNAEGQNQ